MWGPRAVQRGGKEEKNVAAPPELAPLWVRGHETLSSFCIARTHSQLSRVGSGPLTHISLEQRVGGTRAELRAWSEWTARPAELFAFFMLGSLVVRSVQHNADKSPSSVGTKKFFFFFQSDDDGNVGNKINGGRR